MIFALPLSLSLSFHRSHFSVSSHQSRNPSQRKSSNCNQLINKMRSRTTLTQTLFVLISITCSVSIGSIETIEAKGHNQMEKLNQMDTLPAAASAASEQHLLAPELNTDEVREAAAKVAHITDMDAYLAAIDHKMDILQGNFIT